MSQIVITCPNTACSSPLKLAIENVGQPLSCPHCRTPIRIELRAEGGAPLVSIAGMGGWRVPTMLMVPGFALLILGTAGTFANGYLANRAATEPGFAFSYARQRVADVRDGGLAASINPKKWERTPDDVVDSQDAFSAVAGTLAQQGFQLQADDELARHWAPHIADWHKGFTIVSVVMAIGGMCILRGRFYWLALLGSLAGVLNVNLMCCLPGGVAGIWGILMLVRDDGRRHFGMTPRALTTRRSSL